ncbi:MAG TPA: aminopeptidase P family N-terminal domain-containing protein, partial [Terriglobales bacterium]|nr:aminopeptidase P family N-terminal domain-containing protein [Terriglobales bacterium]
MDHARRQLDLQSMLSRHRLEGMLITHLPNIRYLSGFTGSSATLLITENKPVFFTDGRYANQARSEVQGSRVVVNRKTPIATAAEWLIKNCSKLHKA